MTTTAPIAAGTPTDPEWIDLRGLRKMFCIPPTTAYRLIDEGAIKSASVRRRGQVRGKRLIETQSVRDYLNSCANSEGSK